MTASLAKRPCSMIAFSVEHDSEAQSSDRRAVPFSAPARTKVSRKSRGFIASNRFVDTAAGAAVRARTSLAATHGPSGGST